MDIPLINSLDVIWPLDLYANLNPADGLQKPVAPGNPAANPVVAQEPETVQNNLAMLVALNDMNQPFIWAAREAGTANEHALQIAAQDRSFADDTINRMRVTQEYNQIGAMMLVNGETSGHISLMA
jgi:hypothetical protein